MNALRLLTATFAAWAACAAPGYATSLPGVEWTGGYDFGINNGPWAMGYQFQPNQAISVTHLGVFDRFTNGLALSHSVGIWTDDGSLVTSGTVLSGTNSPLLTSNFRYVQLTTPVTLSAGEDYIVAAANIASFNGDEYAHSPGGFAVDPAITFIGSRHQSTGSFVMPSNLGGTEGFFGGNFLFEPVPEPSAISLAALGFVGLCGWAWRRRQSER